MQDGGIARVQIRGARFSGGSPELNFLSAKAGSASRLTPASENDSIR